MDSCRKLSTPQALVNHVLQLISLPEIYLRLQRTIDDPMHTRQQIAEIIVFDPSLAARVLRLANSSYYAFPSEVKSVESAVGIIGEVDLRNLVLATTVVGSMNSLSYEAIDIDAFWMHSLSCGIGARLIARSLGVSDSEFLFLAGILHDIGILVIYQHDAALAAAVNLQIDEKHQLRDQAEREMLGFDHAEVGALLARTWGLAGDLCEMLRCHHQYQLAGEKQKQAMILALASSLANSDIDTRRQPDIDLASMLDQLGIDNPALDELIESRDLQCAEIRNLILG